jgi:hypothetical protein
MNGTNGMIHLNPFPGETSRRHLHYLLARYANPLDEQTSMIPIRYRLMMLARVLALLVGGARR